MSQVAVVGGGIAGLTCAYELGRAGVSVDVYEREPEVGGRMRTRTSRGLPFDLGANFLIRAYRCLGELAEELGLELVNASPVEHHVYRDGRECLMNFSGIRDVFRMDSLHLWSRLRFVAFAVRLRIHHPHLDFFDLSSAPLQFNHDDAYAYACREISHEFADYVLDSFTSCMMFYRSTEISPTAFLTLFSMMSDPTFDFSVLHARGNMQALPEALAARLNVRRGCPVESLHPAPGGWTLQERHYPVVVLATTAGPAAQLLAEGPAEARELAARTRYGSTLNVSFRVPRATLGRTHCFYVPYVESQLISEFTNEALKIHEGQWGLVNVGLHDEAAHRLLESSDEEVYATVKAELVKLNARLAAVDPQPHDMERWREAIPVYDCAHLERVKGFQEAGQGRSGLYLCGDYLNAPWTEGAARNGREVARRIVGDLRG